MEYECSCCFRYLDMLFDPAQIRASDVSTAFLGLASSVQGRWVVWQHLEDNWRTNAVPDG